MDDNDTTAEQGAAQEATALESALAGYHGASREESSPEVPQGAESVDAAGEQAPANEVQAEPDLSAQSPTPESAIAEQLNALKAQVTELRSQSGNDQAVRKLYGEIGNINRTLKQLQSANNNTAPADDELAAAVKAIDDQAKEFPEILGDVAKAMKVIHARVLQNKQDPGPELETETAGQPAEEVPQDGYTPEQRLAIKSLDEVHADRFDVMKTQDYKAWFSSLPAGTQTTVSNTWNPVVVAQHFTDFKAWQNSRKAKQDRLSAAVTPKGGAQRPGPSTISDEEAAWRGYNKRGSRL